MTDDPKNHTHGNHPKENTVAWYFHEFWPIMIFGGFFVLMCAVPVALSTNFAANDVFSSANFVWWGYGLLIISAFIIAWLITFLAPKFMGVYMFLLGVAALILTEHATATQWGSMIAVQFLAFVFFGSILLAKSKDPR